MYEIKQVVFLVDKLLEDHPLISDDERRMMVNGLEQHIRKKFDNLEIDMNNMSKDEAEFLLNDTLHFFTMIRVYPHNCVQIPNYPYIYCQSYTPVKIVDA